MFDASESFQHNRFKIATAIFSANSKPISITNNDNKAFLECGGSSRGAKKEGSVDSFKIPEARVRSFWKLKALRS